MANGHGGARPGAGRKAATTVRYQERMRKVVERTVGVDDWQAVTLKALEQAKEGDFTARNWLTAWVMGKPPEPTNEAATGTTNVYINGLKIDANDQPRRAAEAE